MKTISPRALIPLLLLLLVGGCVTKPEGFLDYQAKAEKGDAKAQNKLGICYATGQGVATNYTEAANWYRKAAEQNYPEAQNYLGVSYNKGQGVKKDFREAVKWFRKAAEQNSAEAQNNLGVCCRDAHGMEPDLPEAAEWFRKAAEQNHAPAQFNLGCCYANGQGVEKDSKEMLKWYRKAAEQNYTDAQYVLGSYYCEGLLMLTSPAPKKDHEPNYVEAYAWFNLAAETDKTLVVLRRIVAKKLSPPQIADGEKRTQELRAQIEAKLKMAGN